MRSLSTLGVLALIAICAGCGGGGSGGGSLATNTAPRFTSLSNLSTRHFWTVPETSLVPGSTLSSANYEVRDLDFTAEFGTLNRPVAFATNGLGEVFIVDVDGEIYIM